MPPMQTSVERRAAAVQTSGSKVSHKSTNGFRRTGVVLDAHRVAYTEGDLA